MWVVCTLTHVPISVCWLELVTAAARRDPLAACISTSDRPKDDHHVARISCTICRRPSYPASGTYQGPERQFPVSVAASLTVL